MDFITLPLVNWPLGIALGALTLILLTGMFFLAIKYEFVPGFAILGAVVVYFAGAMATFHFGWSVPTEAHATVLEEQVKEVYGLELSSEELASLEYPGELPERDFEVFGSFERDEPSEEGFTRTEVFLVWDNGVMELAESEDGENFVSLEAAE